MPALEEQRVACLPGAPARHPAGRPATRTALRPSAWRRSQRVSLLLGRGLLPAPVREACRLCREMAGAAGGNERASLLAKPRPAGKTGMDRDRWESRGASTELHAEPRVGDWRRRSARAGRLHLGVPRAANSSGVTGRRRVSSPTPAHE